MRVLVLGGYGVFGERVARLLRRDGHRVIVAGRDADKAQRLAAELGAESMRLDRRSDLPLLPTLSIDVLVDAAGPFHAYGEQPYALAEACLREGIHYLDLADDAAFCASLRPLNRPARRSGSRATGALSRVLGLGSARLSEVYSTACGRFRQVRIFEAKGIDLLVPYEMRVGRWEIGRVAAHTIDSAGHRPSIGMQEHQIETVPADAIRSQGSDRLAPSRRVDPPVLLPRCAHGLGNPWVVDPGSIALYPFLCAGDWLSQGGHRQPRERGKSQGEI